jgi:hypothetical protein
VVRLAISRVDGRCNRKDQQKIAPPDTTLGRRMNWANPPPNSCQYHSDFTRIPLIAGAA